MIEFRASHSGPPGHADQPIGWWQSPWLIAVIIAATAIPILLTDVPPLVDLPGHMGRYRVQLDLDRSEELRRFFSYEWALIGNLGIDLLVIPFSAAVGLETAVRLVTAAIPALTVWGLLLVAREVHGRIPPTAFLALPFAYGYPFLFGFTNFALSMALALLAFGLWLHLARLGRFRLRAATFVPASLILFFCHTFGWGALGVMCFSAELVRQIDRGKRLLPAAIRAGIHCLALTPPIVFVLLWRSGGGGQTTDWFNWDAKYYWIKWALRDRWAWFDIGALLLVGAVMLAAIWNRRIEYSRNLLASMLFLALVFILLPRIIFGSAYADMRLVPFIFAIGLIGIRLKGAATIRFATVAATIALLFFGARLAGTTASFLIYDRDYDRQLAALDVIPHGARLVSFVGRSCGEPWATTRREHLPAMATVRREAFTNDQWKMPGASLLTVDYPPGGWFTNDPSQIVTPRKCRWEQWLPIADALERLPREAFDYVWLIGPPPYDPSLVHGMVPIWRDGTSVVYRIVDRRPAGG